MNSLNNNIALKDILSLFSQKQEEIKDMSIQQAIQIFLNEKLIHNRAGTYKYYSENLNTMREYLEAKDIMTIHNIASKDLTDYVIYARGRNNKNVSINKRIRCLLTVIDYCIENELITPTNIRYKRLPEEESKIETVDMMDMEKVIQHLPNLSKRSQAIVLLLFTTGIRTTELCNIKIKNIDLENLIIYLEFTKTNSPRYTPILPEVADILKELVAASENSLYLFPEKNLCITPIAVRSLLKRIKKALDIEVLSAHKLRHLYATTLLKQGSDVKTVSKLLGHKSISMTMRYLDITSTEIQEKNKLYNPLNLTSFKKSATH